MHGIGAPLAPVKTQFGRKSQGARTLAEDLSVSAVSIARGLGEWEPAMLGRRLLGTVRLPLTTSRLADTVERRACRGIL